jgi:TonB family protein
MDRLSEQAGQARRRLALAAAYGALILLLAGVGAGRFWEVERGFARSADAIRQVFAVNLEARQAYGRALRHDAPRPTANPAIPHRITFYPDLARRRGEQGEVVLKVLVQPDGQVGDVRVLRTSGSAQLDAAALVSVGGWVYLPAVKGHRPVAAWTLVSVRFQLTS